MKTPHGKYLAILLIPGFLFSTNTVFARQEVSGNVATEYRLFQNPPTVPGQHQNNVSVSVQPEYYRSWDNGKQSLVFAPFLRQDQHDSERSHGDIRELSWIKAADEWELRVGIRHVFWGVTESQHLVDIINQTDAVENFDGEDKLGQPMLNLAIIRDWGTLDLFVLPMFRERTFTGTQGRLGLPFNIDQDNPRYESADEDRHIDLALRWTRSIGDWDVGFSHFAGTSREPLLELSFPVTNPPTLVPVYNQIQQTGLDLQAIYGDWLLKLEMISREELDRRYTAATTGFENTFVGILDTQLDLGILAEYLFDDRHENASSPFSNDLMLGTRLVFNDEQSTELLAGIIIDLDNQGRLFSLEASRRFSDSWKLNIEARLFSHIDSADQLYVFRQQDHLQAELAWYF